MFTRKIHLSWKLGLLAAALLLALSPATPQAGGTPTAFVALGPITAIDAGDVSPAGKSGRFVVKDRTVTGFLFGAIGGAEGAPFQFSFGSNVPLLTQSGQIHGILMAGGYEARVQAASQIGITPAGYHGLLIGGTFTFTSGSQGHGTVDAWFIPIIDPDTGHIVGVFGGAFTLSGQWHQ